MANKAIKAIPVALTLVAFAVMLVGYISQVQRQADLSAMITPDTERALAQLRTTDPEAGIITNSFTLALWISALNKVESPHTWNAEPPPRFTQTYVDVRCVLGWIPECSPLESARTLKAGYVLIEKRFPYYNQRAPGVYGALSVSEPWSSLPTASWLEPIYQQGTTTVWKIAPTSTRQGQ